MSYIHYKLKSTLQYKTLHFDGLHISVDELKKLICEKESIKSESFDLVFTNAHTKRKYNTDDYVPRNSSVAVQRIPRENAVKLPKVQDTSTSGIVSRGASAQENDTGFINASDFEKMSEEQRLAHVKEVSYQKYQPSNYNRKAGAIMSGPPPPTYMCNRCYQHGHWLKNCPLQATRRTTGIPMEELMETSKDDPRALLHPSGKYVVPIMHFNARQQRKQETLPGISGTSGSASGENNSASATNNNASSFEIFAELTCPLCKNLLRDAVLTTCCGDSFCAECIQQRVLDEQSQCPNVECQQHISADSLVPNNKMRQAVQKFLINSGSSASTAGVTPIGANKPQIGNSHSLLHKLLPDLANSAQKVQLNMQPSTSGNPHHLLPEITRFTQSPPAPAPLPTISPPAPAPLLTISPPAPAPLPTMSPPTSVLLATMPSPTSAHLATMAPTTTTLAPPVPLPVLPTSFSFNYPPPNIAVAGLPIADLSQPPPGENSFSSTLPASAPKTNTQKSVDDSKAIRLAWESFMKRDEKANNATVTESDVAMENNVTIENDEDEIEKVIREAETEKKIRRHRSESKTIEKKEKKSKKSKKKDRKEKHKKEKKDEKKDKKRIHKKKDKKTKSHRKEVK